LPSRWWCSSWFVSAGMFFFDLFCGGIVSFFGWNTVTFRGWQVFLNSPTLAPQWAPMLGMSENSDETPKHEKKESEYV
jgi:hypothetical protein